MIYVCVCDGEVIGFAGVYYDLIAAGVLRSDLCSDFDYYCFVGFKWKPEESIFVESLGLLMSEVGRYFSGRTIYNPVHLWRCNFLEPGLEKEV